MVDQLGFDPADFIQIEASVEDEWHDRLWFAHEASWCTLEDLGDLLMDRDGGPATSGRATALLADRPHWLKPSVVAE